MKRPIVKLTLFVLRVLMGVSDTVLPNIQNSIKNAGKCPVTKKNEYKLDWVRLITAFITFVILVLNFLGYTDIAGFISKLFGIKG